MNHANSLITYNYGEEHAWMRQNVATRTVCIKVTNRSNVVTFHYSHDGGAHWTQHPWQMKCPAFITMCLAAFWSLRVGV